MANYKRILAGFSLVCLVFLISSLAAAQSDPGGLPSLSNQPPPFQTQPISPTATALDVFITAEGIFPSVLAIPPGVTIQWTNQTSQTQRLAVSSTSNATTIYLPLISKGSGGQSDSPTNDETSIPNFTGQDANWQNTEILPGDSFSHTFDWSGNYPYSLTDSPSLTGTVVVEPPLLARSSGPTLIVTTLTDDRTNNGNCTLREAIIAANTNKAVDACPAGGYDDTIILSSGTYSLTLQGKNEDAAAAGDLDINSKVTIVGASDGQTIIDASKLSDRVLHVLCYGNLTLSNVTIVKGTGDGAGIFNVGTLTLNNSTLQNNSTTGGGGGLKNDGYATVKASTISGNSAGYGGGVYNRGTLTLNNSTISGNTASWGGGIKNQGTLKFNNSTISGNTAGDNGGGGIYNYSYGKVAFQNSIIAGNTSSTSTRADCAYLSSGSLGYNLVGNGTGCPLASTDLKLNPAQIFTSVLGPLQNNGGSTFTHALLPGSPALDAGNPNGCKDSNGNLLTTDQRGELRPADGNNDAVIRCDIGAYEAQNTDPAQTGPTYVINVVTDSTDGVCSQSNCSLREAVQAANTHSNNLNPDSGRDEIHFNISPAGPQTIFLSSTLVITDPVIIDGLTQAAQPDQPAASCSPLNLLIRLDGTSAGPTADGLTISAGNTTVRGLAITHFGQNGLRFDTSGGNVLECNAIGTDTGASGPGNTAAGVFVSNVPNNTIGGTAPISGNLITGNGGAGIVISGTNATGNAIRLNSIFSNTTISSNTVGIDLGGDGITSNDKTDPDTGPNNFQNIPVINSAVPNNDGVVLEGQLNSIPNTGGVILDFFANPTCDPSGFGQGRTFLGSTTLLTPTTAAGNVTFSGLSFPLANPAGQFVTATATDASGNTSEFSACTRVDENNISWPRAKSLNPGSENTPAVVEQSLDKLGESRWYKFSVKPNSRVIVTLTNLPANYDLTIYKDIAQAFNQLNSTQDLLRLGAEFAAGARSPDEFAAGARSPDAFAAGARSPDAFAVGNFSPDVFAAGARSPDAFAAGARSPDAFAAGARSPDVFAPDAFAADAFAAGARSPDDIAAGARSPEFLQAFASAQTRSLIGFSAFEGTASEGIILNTWNNAGDFYVRVRGRDGAFDMGKAFHLQVTLVSGTCNNVSPLTAASTTSVENGGYETIILTDLGRMAGTPEEKKALWQALNTFVGLGEIKGKIINVGPYQFNDPNFPDLPGDARVLQANNQADRQENLQCPYAKNLAAQAIKDIIDAYRGANPLKYIVLVGNDNVIPFFRYPDSADLGPESDFVPPVFDFTTSQASLKLNYVLSQDAYGAKIGISLNINEFPIPDLPVGRLVETPADIIKVLEAYGQTNGGVVTPNSALVTGYDFFADAATEIRQQLESGLGASLVPTDTLITARDVSPLDPSAWTADDLRTSLLGRRHDLVFLGGHFSAASALAADYQTRLVSSDLVSSPVNLENAVIFSIGCHSGYNIVNEHGIPLVTREPDWAQAFAQKGATLIAGTGYQYGDTDFVEYSERIYLEFARQLRIGSDPVAVGTALMKAKQRYLAETPEIRGLHEKALLISTLFGLPMLKVNMPGERLASGGFPTISGAVGLAANNPGAALNLAVTVSDLEINTNVRQSTVMLKDTDIDNPSPAVDALVLKSLNLDGVERSLTNPGEPVLPLWLGTVPGSDNRVLRGVGFRGGNYSDSTGVRPLTGAATTEIRGVHTSFLSDVFFPIQPWRINYFDALTNGSGGATTLALMPAQFKSDDPIAGTNILREFDTMKFRLYYSDNTSSSALAAAPTIAGISAIPTGSSVNFKINVVGDPTAGIQEVWITYTATGGPWAGKWQSLDLTQSTNDSTLWTGTLDLGGISPKDVRYIVQAANGVGLVSLATNVGAYYTPGVTTVAGDPTALSLELPGPGVYGAQASFSAVLSSSGTGLAGQPVTISLGSQSRQALTDGSGRATVTLPLLALPGSNNVRAAFGGTVEKAPSSTTGEFTIEKQSTNITLTLNNGTASSNSLVQATLQDAAGRGLAEKTIFFVVSGSGVFSTSVPVITDYAGRAPIGNLPLPPGTYTVKAYFNGEITLSTGQKVTLDDVRYVPSTATGSFEVTNTPPVVKDHAYSVNEDVTLMVSAPGVLGDASDADGDTLTAIKASDPISGTVTLNADGSFTYIPNANFNGTDSFTFKANDGSTDSNVATVTLTVNPINDAPVANNDTYSVNEDTALTVAASGVLSNDSDVEGNSLTAVLVSGPANGSLTLNANGSFTYTPKPNFNGADSFTYKVNDGSVDSNGATVAITVNSVNDAPMASNNAYTVTQKSTLVITAPGVLANDSDIDSTGLTAILVSSPSKGSLTLNANGAFTYTPNTDFYGTDTFTYKANDGSANSNVATVTITVKRLNRPPVCSLATAKPISIWPPNKDTFILENVIGVTDPDGDPITINITKIRQDEPTGTGKYGQDGYILGANSVKLRGERDGKGDGRVYHIFYSAHDDKGEYCEDSYGSHELKVKAGIVPHDQESNLGAIDQGPKYDSTVAK